MNMHQYKFILYRLKTDHEEHEVMSEPNTINFNQLRPNGVKLAV